MRESYTLDTARLKIVKLQEHIREIENRENAYVVTYMNNTMGVFLSEKEANEYSDKFGGVYRVTPVNIKNAVLSFSETSF